MMERITSRTNSLMTHVRKLTSSRSYRRKQGEFVCDGVKMLEEAAKWGAEVTALISTAGVSLPQVPAARQVEVPEDVMRSISPMEAPQGALFLCRMGETVPPVQLTGNRYLVLDGLQDPGNVGTIWRTADAFSADGLILVNHCADPYNPKTVRATMGAVFRLPAYEMTVEQLCAMTAAAQLPLLATALREDTLTLGQFPLSKGAVVIGSEGSGVSQTLLDACAQTIKIPMRATCESLNAATAAAVVLWEMARTDERAE